MSSRVVGVVAALAVLAGCSDEGETRPPAVVVRVLAASSLTDVFPELGHRYTEANPEVRIDFTFSTSDVLFDQIERGAAAAVLATADPAVMDEAERDGFARSPRPFARNRLALVVRSGGDVDVDGFDDLGRDDMTFAACAEHLVCGSLARRALERSGVEREPDVVEGSVSAVRQRVVDGDVDAGIVFVTTPGDDLDFVTELDEPALDAVYEVAALSGAVARDEAEAWIAFVLSSEGQRILAANGFGRA